MLARKMQATIPVLFFSAMKVLRFFFFPVTSTSEIVFLLLSLRKNRLKIFESERLGFWAYCVQPDHLVPRSPAQLLSREVPHIGGL